MCGWVKFDRKKMGLVWFGLVWFGLVWFGLVCFGLVWFALLLGLPRREFVFTRSLKVATVEFFGCHRLFLLEGLPPELAT